MNLVMGRHIFWTLIVEYANTSPVSLLLHSRDTNINIRDLAVSSGGQKTENLVKKKGTEEAP